MNTRHSSAMRCLSFAVIALASCSQAPASIDESLPAQAAEAASPVGSATTAMMDHSHIPIDVPGGVPVPSLSIQVERDWMSGLNLTLHTENYALIPPPAGLDMAALMTASIQADTGLAEGHAHLYVNGEKVQRIYGETLHLPDTLFKPGLNQISVSINNHGHMYWTADNRQILATLYVDLSKDDLVTHRFESYPTMKSADGSLCVQGTKAKT